MSVATPTDPLRPRLRDDDGHGEAQEVAGAFDKPSNVAIYWGQNSYNQANGPLAQQSLADYCANSSIDIIPMAFMVQVTSGQGGQPVLNFANQQNNCTLFDGTQLINCPQIGEDIKSCQQKYKKTILLSIGGATYTEGGFDSEDDAVAAANMIWKTFGPMESSGSNATAATNSTTAATNTTTSVASLGTGTNNSTATSASLGSNAKNATISSTYTTSGISAHAITSAANLTTISTTHASTASLTATAKNATTHLTNTTAAVATAASSLSTTGRPLKSNYASAANATLAANATSAAKAVSFLNLTFTTTLTMTTQYQLEPRETTATSTPATAAATTPSTSTATTTTAAAALRPFGDAVLDGFDFDFETTIRNSVPFAKQLRKLMDADQSRQYYLTAAPQCPFPDAADSPMFDGGIPFDAVFVQFYNNFCGVQAFSAGSGSSGGGGTTAGTAAPAQNNFNFETWDTWAKNGSANPNVKVFLGVPAGQTAAGSGYENAEQLKPVIDFSRNFSSFGGVMMWDVSQAYANTGFLDGVKNSVMAPATKPRKVRSSARQAWQG